MPHVQQQHSPLNSTCLWVELSLFSIAWVDSLSVINIFWLILCELTAKREKWKNKLQICAREEHCPCHTPLQLLPAPLPFPLACCCQRLQTRFNDFHVACWRQLALNLCKMFSSVARVIQYTPHSPPPLHHTLYWNSSGSSLYQSQISASSSSLAFKSRALRVAVAFIDLCFINENNINWIIMNSCESRRMADVGLQIETKLWISLA